MKTGKDVSLCTCIKCYLSSHAWHYQLKEYHLSSDTEGGGGREGEALFFFARSVMYISRTKNITIHSIQQAIALKAKMGHCVAVLRHRAICISALNACMAHFGPC